VRYKFCEAMKKIELFVYDRTIVQGALVEESENNAQNIIATIYVCLAAASEVNKPYMDSF
jgi:hypothetical protein